MWSLILTNNFRWLSCSRFQLLLRVEICPIYRCKAVRHTFAMKFAAGTSRGGSGCGCGGGGEGGAGGGVGGGGWGGIKGTQSMLLA